MPQKERSPGVGVRSMERERERERERGGSRKGEGEGEKQESKKANGISSHPPSDLLEKMPSDKVSTAIHLIGSFSPCDL